jgi:hypothetical protein
MGRAKIPISGDVEGGRSENSPIWCSTARGVFDERLEINIYEVLNMDLEVGAIICHGNVAGLYV